MNILVVEDSKRLQESLKRGLSSVRFTVDVAGDGVAACLHLDNDAYELVVLDLGMPRKDGLAVLRHMRERKERPRVLVLSARDRVVDNAAHNDWQRAVTIDRNERSRSPKYAKYPCNTSSASTTSSKL